jgi:hypothetical protein
MPSRPLSRAPPSFTGDELKTLALPSNDEGLQHPTVT